MLWNLSNSDLFKSDDNICMLFSWVKISCFCTKFHWYLFNWCLYNKYSEDLKVSLTFLPKIVAQNQGCSLSARISISSFPLSNVMHDWSLSNKHSTDKVLAWQNSGKNCDNRVRTCWQMPKKTLIRCQRWWTRQTIFHFINAYIHKRLEFWTSSDFFQKLCFLKFELITSKVRIIFETLRCFNLSNVLMFYDV